MKRPPKLIQPTRRQVLGMLTAAAAVSTFDPIRMLVQSLVDGLLNKAQAVGTADPRNYFYVHFPMAPPRYHWDLPLCPYQGLNDPNYVYPTASMNPGLVNKFKNATGIEMEYGTAVVVAPRSGVKLRMPYLWSQTIPTSAGTWIPMATLLDNMIFIRGLQSLDGHLDSQLIQLRPKPGAPSMDGAVTDASNRAVPSLALGGSPNIYNSAKGISNIRMEALGSNPLASILAPFDRRTDNLNSQYLSRRDAMDAAISKAMEALGAAAKARHPGADVLWANRGTAEAMIKKGLGDISTVYTTLLNKYKALIQACATEHAQSRSAFFTDRPLAYNQIPNALWQGVSPFVTSVQDTFPNASVNGLAESFAIAEYLFANGYSSAITAGVTGVGGLQVSGYANWGWDEHTAGALISMVLHGFTWRAVAACLYEFTQSLRKAGVFDNTIIHLGAEFSRSPLKDQTGSDHSPDGAAISLISGLFRQPYVIGDTQPSAGDAMHTGNFGIGTAIQFDGGLRQPTASNQASTLAHLLRVKSPSPNDASLLIESTSGVAPAVDLAKNKGES